MTFDRQVAIALAQASDFAYGIKPLRPTKELLAIDPSFTVSSFEMIERGTSELLIIRGDNTTILAFRGSDEAMDWFKNIDMLAADNSYGSSHRGFDDEVGKLMEICLNEYDKAGLVFVTGHSKGGGVGVCFLNRLRAIRNASKLHSAYFFGSPRALCPGTAEPFTVRYKGRVIRVRNNNDAVCDVPPYPLYKHVNQDDEVYISRNGKLWFVKVDPWRLIYDRAMGRVDAWRSGRMFDGIHDHYPIDKRYVAKLQSTKTDHN